jgi:hypothetical protein
VVWILVNHNLVRVPQPSITVADIVWGDAEVKPAKPKPRRATSGQVPYVAGSKAARKVSVSPGVVQVIVRIVPSCIVSNPFVVWMHVRCFWVSRGISEIVGLGSGMPLRHRVRFRMGFWTVSRNVTAAIAVLATASVLLRKTERETNK